MNTTRLKIVSVSHHNQLRILPERLGVKGPVRPRGHRGPTPEDAWRRNHVAAAQRRQPATSNRQPLSTREACPKGNPRRSPTERRRSGLRRPCCHQPSSEATRLSSDFQEKDPRGARCGDRRPSLDRVANGRQLTPLQETVGQRLFGHAAFPTVWGFDVAGSVSPSALCKSGWPW